ncbi:permease [Acinetobacter qingfengensis]|uniref:Permease n=1 Tax=Acinetobacter qingfengensis TaxID=1262585 RepID=A0A1E7RE91_9GAMM|nr:permease [Acinetobacter qingfengensis]KAA8734511.1 permease [Acinetobacter qingfengensis]OEY97547.1 permease [Acinetobacter qingfengensis]
MSLALPVISFVLGLMLADRFPKLKRYLAQLLSQFLIPYVIVYNMVFYQPGSINLIAFSLLSSAILYAFYLCMSTDKVQALCISYPNLAWLGFPVAFAIFGDQVSAAMVSLYIGGSLFGNVIAVAALSPQINSVSYFIQRILKSPPVIALAIATILRLTGIQHWQSHDIADGLYEFVKVATSFAGMFVLGMWMRHTKILGSDLVFALRQALIRLSIGVGICILTWYVFHFAQVDQYIAVMLMIFFLPPGANIVSLETYYAGTGKSAQYIAAGTVVSCGLLLFYGLFIHWLY